MKNGYHHRNLKQELIDTGIKIFNTEGEQGLSLRKVAASCGVSHAAPYAHFKDKDDMVNAMKSSVTEQFSAHLNKAIAEVSNNQTEEDVKTEDTEQLETKILEEKIVALGREYVRFFIENPDYYKFLFYGQKITVHLGVNDDYSNDYTPYKIFRDIFEQYIARKFPDISGKDKETQLIRAWTVVQGLSSIACMGNVSASMPWDEYIESLIS